MDEAHTILTGGEILTLDPESPHVEALAVGDGKIIALGTESEVLAAAQGPATLLIDLEGKILAPSFKDHHLHVLDVGLSLLNARREEALFLDLSKARSPEEIASRVRDRAAQMPEGTWILGKAWSQGAWGDEALPTHHVLTEAAPRHPVFLTRIDAHCGWANAEALRMAGITRDTADPHGGSILRLDDGTPSGILLERANEPVLALIPGPADEDIAEAFDLAAHELAARGITEVYDGGFLGFPGVVGMNAPFERLLDLLKQADVEEPLPIRVNLMIPSPSALADKVVERPEAFRFSPGLGVTHIKLFLDGAFGSRGAALRYAYTDDPSTRGVFRMTVEELESELTRAMNAGLDVATHVIGDDAVSRVLDVYESLLTERPDLAPRRLRIEHLSYASDEDIERAARLGILLVVQPGFVYPDVTGRTMEDDRLGQERSRGAYAFARLDHLGAAMAGSSDDLTIPPSPFWAFYAAVTRKNPEGVPPAGWHSDERLTRERSLRLFTRFYPQGGGGGEPSGGSLRIGGPADCVILSANPLTVEESKILDIRIHATMLGGEVTFTDGTPAGLQSVP
jgi:predicted amidohydrolase YtcJ